LRDVSKRRIHQYGYHDLININLESVRSVQFLSAGIEYRPDKSQMQIIGYKLLRVIVEFARGNDCQETINPIGDLASAFVVENYVQIIGLDLVN
jgi:hypothetical protein